MIYFIHVFFLFLIVGCAQIIPHVRTEVERVTPSGLDYPKLSEDKVIVFYSKKFAPKKYRVLAHIKSINDLGDNHKEQLIHAFREKAAELGADGIILLETMKETPGLGPGKITSRASDLNCSDPEYSSQPFTKAYVPVGETLIEKDTWYLGYALAIRVLP